MVKEKKEETKPATASAKKIEAEKQAKAVGNVVNEIKERFGEGAIMTMREIRTIRNSTSVTTASAAQLRFIDTNNTDITYSLSSTNLNRTANGTANLLAENVSSLAFTYYDSSGTVIPVPTVSPSATNIRRVRVSLTLTKNGQNVYLRSDSATENF